MKPHAHHTREVPLVPCESALLLIDVQNFSARPDGGEFKDVPVRERQTRLGYYFERLNTTVVPSAIRARLASGQK